MRRSSRSPDDYVVSRAALAQRRRNLRGGQKRRRTAGAARPSTIVRLDGDEWKITRVGGISEAEIAGALS